MARGRVAGSRFELRQHPGPEGLSVKAQTRTAPPSWLGSGLLLLTLLLAFGLRLYRLADKPIWWDEGWSVWLARHDLIGIAIRTASDEHPPLHYWLLHFWNALAGED